MAYHVFTRFAYYVHTSAFHWLTVAELYFAWSVTCFCYTVFFSIFARHNSTFTCIDNTVFVACDFSAWVACYICA